MIAMETSSPTGKFERISEYLKMRDQYYKNAEEFIGRGELRKSSELLWGAISQSIKALGILANQELVSHRDFFPFMQQLSKELGDPSLYEDFVDLNTLHRNFYDEFIPPEAFPLFFRKATLYVKRINDLIQTKVGRPAREKG